MAHHKITKQVIVQRNSKTEYLCTLPKILPTFTYLLLAKTYSVYVSESGDKPYNCNPHSKISGFEISDKALGWLVMVGVMVRRLLTCF